MAKAAPSKKTAKAAKSASTGAKKTRKAKRSETFNSYIHKVLKQVHPGAWRSARGSPLVALSPRARRTQLTPSSHARPFSSSPARRDWHLQEGHDGHELLCQRHL
jgi:hypothetical protein